MPITISGAFGLVMASYTLSPVVPGAGSETGALMAAVMVAYATGQII
jgi:hypothetical protein